MSESVLAEAERIIGGDRREAYGDVDESFTRTALVWSGILGITVTPTQVAQCMIGIKLTRINASPDHRDSWVDVCGYAALGEQVSRRTR